jgi:PAS domain S-box-containing protein
VADWLSGPPRELLANLSHDLRTPLASLQGYLELLLLQHDRLPPAEARNYLETAARQGERLSRLVVDLFDLARLEADDMQPDLEPLPPAELAQDLLQKFAPEAARRQVQLVGPDSAALPLVRADIGLVERLVDHLMGNALRHTPAGGAVGIALEVGVDSVRLCVHDSGAGIAAQDLPGLFERYHRAARVGGPDEGGHGGLGLAIARRIAQLHGSTLDVDSAPAQGTRVSFSLPRADAPAPPAPAAPDTAPPSADLRAALARSEARRAAAEADLRAAEQRYLAALRGSQDGLWEWELSSGAVHLSPRWKSMLGFEAAELADHRDAWLGRVHADDRAGFEQALARHIAGAGPVDHELRLLDKQGGVRHVLSRATVIRGADGLPYRVVGMDTDITRLCRAQAVLDAVADGTAGQHGQALFAALAEHFARALGVDVAFIAECIDTPPTRVRTLAYWSRQRGAVPSFEFDLSGTPCEDVLRGGVMCFHPQGVAERFPREAAYQAYLGMPIVGSDGRLLGHLALFHRQPLGDEVLVDRVFRIFLARAASEIERLQALAAR